MESDHFTRQCFLTHGVELLPSFVNGQHFHGVKLGTATNPVQLLTTKEVTSANLLSDRRRIEAASVTNASFLTTVDAWRKMFQHEYWQKHGGKLPQEIQAIRLDRDTALVALPHEVFVELGLAIKSASPFRTTIVISLANDLDFYLPTRRAVEEGHYEPTTCPLEPGCGERLVQTAVNLLHELKP